MKKKKGKYTIKTKGRMLVIFFLFGAAISTLGYTLFFNIKQISQMKGEMSELETEISELEEEEETILADIKRLSDPEYVARYAREKYFYSKEGEIILRFDDD